MVTDIVIQLFPLNKSRPKPICSTSSVTGPVKDTTGEVVLYNEETSEFGIGEIITSPSRPEWIAFEFGGKAFHPTHWGYVPGRRGSDSSSETQPQNEDVQTWKQIRKDLSTGQGE